MNKVDSFNRNSFVNTNLDSLCWRKNRRGMVKSSWENNEKGKSLVIKNPIKFNNLFHVVFQFYFYFY